MNEIKLIEPTVEYAKDIWQFRKEIIESDDEDKFAGCCNLENCNTAEEWIEHIVSVKSGNTDMIPANVYIAVRLNDNKIVGIIDLRHHINNPVLGTWGGHIGYCVRPCERCKGYAKEMLRQNLINCKKLGIDKVLMTCQSDNRGSEKTILANGGVFESAIDVDSKTVKRYWIKIGD